MSYLKSKSDEAGTSDEVELSAEEKKRQAKKERKEARAEKQGGMRVKYAKR